MRQLLNWFRRGSLERGLDRELQYHFDRRVTDLVRLRPPGARGPAPRRARTRRPHAGPRGSPRRLAQPLVARLPLRSPLLRALLPPQPVLHRHRRALARARHRRHHGHLLPGRSGDPARASGPRARAPRPRRLEGTNRSASGFGTYNLMSYPICRDLQQQTRFFDGVLCRAATDGQPLHRRRTQARRRGNRLRQLLLRCSASAPRSAASSEPKTTGARRQSGRGALLRLLADAVRRRCRCRRPQGPRSTNTR